MASITIRRLSEETKQRLRERAAANRRSMEEEARQILEKAVEAPPLSGRDFLRRIREIVGPEGIDLPEIPRNEYPRDPFADWK